jgi:hypothetical protein
MAAYEISLSPIQQTMAITLGTTPYTLRFFFVDADEGGWCMDISDQTGAPILCGVPLVTGTDLLAQYAYLAIGGVGTKMFVRSDGTPDDVPTYANLGVTSHLYFRDNT